MPPLTRSCFLLLLLKRLFLLASFSFLESCLLSLWSTPSPLHAPALNPPLSCQGATLAHLDSLSLLMIWYSGQTALILFSLAKAAPAYLPTALSVVLRPLFPFQQAQCAQVFLLKPAPFCTFIAGLGSTNKSALLFSSSAI